MSIGRAKPGDIKLDWKAYFYQFCAVHGEPVYCRGRLLFRDGWMHSDTSYQGPEWAPPTDRVELAKLKLEYWTLQFNKLNKEYVELTQEYKGLMRQSRTFSLPLQQRVTYKTRDDETGKVKVKKGVPEDFDPSVWEDHIADLKELVAEASQQINELRKELKYDPVQSP